MPKGRGQQVKKCRICGVKFEPVRSLQLACSMECAIGHANKITEKKQREKELEERRETRARKEALKRPKTLKAEAQAAFNAYRRTSDLMAGHRCICCDQPFEPQKPGGSVDAGHYLSVGSAPHLRFNEINVNAQRKNCNRPGGTTREKFRAGMIRRYGLEAVQALEADRSEPRYRDDDYRRIRDEYKQKLKELQRMAA